jgi:hypothetical protein
MQSLSIANPERSPHSLTPLYRNHSASHTPNAAYVPNLRRVVIPWLRKPQIRPTFPDPVTSEPLGVANPERGPRSLCC